jgi:hypothetical protein
MADTRGPAVRAPPVIVPGVARHLTPMRAHYCESMPPSTVSVCPTTKLACDEAR